MKKNLYHSFILGIAACCMVACGCSKTSTGNTPPVTPPPVTPPVTPPTTTSEVDYWLTRGDKTALLAKQTTALVFTSSTANPLNINVDSTQKFQTVDGFGYTFTQGSAFVINQLNATAKANLLTELFSTSGDNMGISYLRVGIGATDLSSTVFSYNDMPAGQTDVPLANFGLADDLTHVIPLLKQIVAINPNIKIMGTPWSPPVWMKTGSTTAKGGSLNPAYYTVYANYLVKYIQAMKAQGITIDAITPQNEPLNPDNTPSLSMTAAEQTTFIKNHLGPAFAAANITTKIIAYDHNLDRTDYPLAVLGDPAANAFVDGSAFHLYGGNISSMSLVHNAFPNKNVYFTEQYTASTGEFKGDLMWHLKNVIIGSMRNWGKTALEWNLANDASYGPHTPGGCTTCLGALTISGGTIVRNVGYYIVAQASRFVPAGSVRIASDNSGVLTTAAFVRPDGKKALIVMNEGSTTQQFSITFKGKIVTTSLPGEAVCTYVW